MKNLFPFMSCLWVSRLFFCPDICTQIPSVMPKSPSRVCWIAWVALSGSAQDGQDFSSFSLLQLLRLLRFRAYAKEKGDHLFQDNRPVLLNLAHKVLQKKYFYNIGLTSILAHFAALTFSWYSFISQATQAASSVSLMGIP